MFFIFSKRSGMQRLTDGQLRFIQINCLKGKNLEMYRRATRALKANARRQRMRSFQTSVLVAIWVFASLRIF